MMPVRSDDRKGEMAQGLAAGEQAGCISPSCSDTRA